MRAVPSWTVDTLDNALTAFLAWRPNSFKTDIEGADLDALMGGEAALTAALGVQVEASFVERNDGASPFSEINQRLRACA